MNATLICWCCLVILISSIFPAKVPAQTVEDTGSKWRLELQMRSEASRIREDWRRSNGEVPTWEQIRFRKLEEMKRRDLEELEKVKRRVAELKRRLEMEPPDEALRKSRALRIALRELQFFEAVSGSPPTHAMPASKRKGQQQP